HETADTIDPSGTLGKVCDIAMVVQAQVPPEEGLQSRLGPSNPRPSGKVGSVPKAQTGRGTGPGAMRDPQRAFTPKQKVEKLGEQGGTCAGCGKKLKLSDAKGHHIKRWANGGRTVQSNHAVVCKSCHVKIHKP